MAKEKIYEFELFRAFAIIAVVLIHSTSFGVGELDPQSRLHVLFQLMNKLASFAVPSFIFMSGLVLFYSYFAKWQAKDALMFYVKRLKFVVVPYLMVSIFYYLYIQRLYFGTIDVNLKQFLLLLKWGDAGYHLYFIIIIVQFYLLFPLLMMLVKKFPWVQRNVAYIGIALFLIFYFLSKNFTIPHRSTLCFTYFIYFFLGAALGMNYKRALEVILKHRLWIIILAAVTGGGLTLLYILSDFNQRYSNYFFDLCFYAYGAFASLALLWFSFFITQKNYSKLSSILQSIGKHSFGIYLIHPAIMSLYVLKLKRSGGSLSFLLYFIGCYLVVFIGAYLITILIKKWIKPYWILIGK